MFVILFVFFDYCLGRGIGEIMTQMIRVLITTFNFNLTAEYLLSGCNLPFPNKVSCLEFLKDVLGFAHRF